MTGQRHWSHARPKKNSDLIHHFGRGKQLPCNWVFCGHDFCREIIGRCASRQRLCALIGQLSDQSAYHLRAAPGSAGKGPRNPAGQAKECCKIDHRLAALIGLELLKHLPRHAILNWNRE